MNVSCSWTARSRFCAVIALGAVLLTLPAVALADAKISGHVTAAVGGASIGGANVSVVSVSGTNVSGGGPFITGTDGSYETGVLPSGQYKMVFSSPSMNYAPTYYGSGPEGQFHWLFVDPLTVADTTVTRDAALQVGSNITITVKRPVPLGTPIEGVYAALIASPPAGHAEGPQYGSLTDENGQVTYTKVLPGQWRVDVSDMWYDSWRYAPVFYPDTDPQTYVTLAAGATTPLTLVMCKYASAQVQVANGEAWQRDAGGGVAVTVTRDDLGDFGATNVFYRMPPGAPVNAGSVDTTVVPVTGEGDHEFVAYTRGTPDDTIWGPEAIAHVRIDNSPPMTTSNCGMHTTQPTLVLSASDALSGADKRYYTLDGSGPTEYIAPVALSAGVHSVTYWSVDHAGNVESVRAGTIISGPQPGVSKPSGSKSVKVKHYATYRGTLSKRVRNRSHLVLEAYRWDGARWVLKRTKTVHVTTPRRGKARYSGRIRFTSKGSWKVVAHFKGSGTWQPAWSAARYVRVK